MHSGRSDLECIGRGVDPNLAIASLCVNVNGQFTAVIEARPWNTLKTIFKRKCRLLIWGDNDARWVHDQFGDEMKTFHACTLDLQGDKFYLRHDEAASVKARIASTCPLCF